MKVPFLDLKAHHEPIQNEINETINCVIKECAFAGGTFVEKFENEFAEFCQCRYAIGVGSGTEALWIALLALGIGAGDEVITVPNTFIATAEAISFCGARPVFVDIDEQTYTMNPDLLEDAITPQTRAIIPVHLYGQPAEMDRILKVAKNHGLFVIEDAAQAHGACSKQGPAGSIGEVGCFSFYPGKNLGAFGEAGAIVTNHPEIASKSKILRDHGQPKKYFHNFIGWNSRMDGLQGAVLSVKLSHLKASNRLRQKNAQMYNTLLAGEESLILPAEADGNEHVYHIYAVRSQKRDALLSYLQDKDIYCGIHYPVPLHLTEAYRHLGYAEGSFAIAERCSQEVLSLPMFPELTNQQIEYVADSIINFFKTL